MVFGGRKKLGGVSPRRGARLPLRDRCSTSTPSSPACASSGPGAATSPSPSTASPTAAGSTGSGTRPGATAQASRSTRGSATAWPAPSAVSRSPPSPSCAHRPIPLHALAARVAARGVGVVPLPGQESVMRILVVGSGGVGSAFAMIARRRDFFEEVVLADLDEGRARTAAEKTGDPRFRATAIDASDRAAVAECARAHGATHVLNAADPRFVMPIFGGAFDAGATYLDMAMSLSHAPPGATARGAGREARRRAVRRGGRVGGRPGCSRWSAWASSPGCPTCSRATPPTSCSARSTSAACATAPTSWWTATPSRRRSRSGRRSRSASTRR